VVAYKRLFWPSSQWRLSQKMRKRMGKEKVSHEYFKLLCTAASQRLLLALTNPAFITMCKSRICWTSFPEVTLLTRRKRLPWLAKATKRNLQDIVVKLANFNVPLTVDRIRISRIRFCGTFGLSVLQSAFLKELFKESLFKVTLFLLDLGVPTGKHFHC